jgi:DNA polymerase-4
VDPSILHADLDAFYASVEQLLQPELRGKPIAVGGGVVLAASYEARAFGVRSGMPGRRARELCPGLIFTGGHFSEYQRLGDAAIAVLADFTPDVERISIDEAFADVSGSAQLFGAPADIASRVRARVREELGCRSPSAWRAPSTWRRSPPRSPSRMAGRRRSGGRARLPARPAGRAHVGRRTGDAGPAGEAGVTTIGQLAQSSVRAMERCSAAPSAAS